MSFYSYVALGITITVQTSDRPPKSVQSKVITLSNKVIVRTYTI